MKSPLSLLLLGLFSASHVLGQAGQAPLEVRCGALTPMAPKY